jgi:L-lactate dehydrogenase complex protein LldG
MSAARHAILNAAVKALPRTRPGDAEIGAEARLLIENLEAVRPALPQAKITECFLQRVAASKAGATADCIATIDELPRTVAQHLIVRGLPPVITLQPSPLLASLDWAGSGIATDGTARDGIVVGLARWGIAEFGSLVFHSAADMPILLNFLPAAHIVAVRASVIVPYLEDYAAAARKSGDAVPRNACLITGASGTTDIEGNLVLGAHGPRELHVVVIDGAGGTV